LGPPSFNIVLFSETKAFVEVPPNVETFGTGGLLTAMAVVPGAMMAPRPVSPRPHSPQPFAPRRSPVPGALSKQKPDLDLFIGTFNMGGSLVRPPFHFLLKMAEVFIFCVYLFI